MAYLWFLLLGLGAFKLSQHLILLILWVYAHFLRPPKDLKKVYGSWALITGPTDGIGKSFARRLAQKGLNLILVSRNLQKLEDVSKEIMEESPGVKIKVVALDFTSSEISLKKAIDGLEVGILINNAGMTYPRPSYFHELEEKAWKDIVNVNSKAATEVIREVIPEMISRKRGAIVNISSGASNVVPSHPLFAIYAASKGYLDILSRSLQVEYKQYGIDVQNQVPLYVATKMAKERKPSLFVPTADEYAEAAIRRIGYEGRCSPYWPHSVQWFLVKLCPDAIINEWRLYDGLSRKREDERQRQKNIKLQA